VRACCCLLLLLLLWVPVGDAVANARHICQDHYGLFDAPPVKLHCNPALTFTYIPSHLHHILFELLKNSLRGTSAKSPPMHVGAELMGKGSLRVHSNGGARGRERRHLPGRPCHRRRG
jgi:hypothetical protein